MLYPYLYFLNQLHNFSAELMIDEDDDNVDDINEFALGL